MSKLSERAVTRGHTCCDRIKIPVVQVLQELIDEQKIRPIVITMSGELRIVAVEYTSPQYNHTS